MEKYKKLIELAREPLTDKEYLNKFINDMHLFKGNEFCGINNPDDARYIALTNISSKNLGFNSANQALGQTYYDIPSKAVEAAKNFHEQDAKVAQSKIISQMLDIHDLATGFFTLITTKIPIINPSTNNSLATFWLCNNFNLEMNLKTILNIHQSRFGNYASIEISKHAPCGLTILERDALFCFCLGICNKKDIADFLSKVHKRQINYDTTINDAIRRLYRKLNCNTPYQLVEFAVYHGLHLQIPQAFLPTGSYALE